MDGKVMKMESDENFLEWMLFPGRKLQIFRKIKDQMKSEYLKDPYDWVISFSGGKDSTLVATLVWEMLEELSPSKRRKKVHIVSSDTLVETKRLTDHLHANLKMMEENGEELGIRVHLVRPRMIQRFFRHVIGLGVMPPVPGRGFRWCTSRLKIEPMNQQMKEILAQQPVILPEPPFPYRLTVLLGVRLDESVHRAASIRKHTGDDGLFGMHDYIPDARVYHPIKFVSTDDLWNYLRYRTTLPWGTPLESLESLYGNPALGECPVIRSKKEWEQACGGNSRNGCWVCLMGGRKDKMLEELIAGGDESASYLAEWKRFLYDITFDVRYKDPIKGMKKLEQRKKAEADMGFLEDTNLWYADEFERYMTEYELYDRAQKGNGNGEYDPGKFTFEMRRILLEKLLYTQQKAGYTLISEEEISLILEEWAKEGFHVSRQELRPINHQHDGAVVLRRDWTINEEETTNPNPVFFVEIPLNMSAAELAAYHKNRQRLTGKSIFCFFGHKDYCHAKSVFNTATFLVCREGIKTLEQARAYVHEWLFLEGKVGTDGQTFVKMTKEAFRAAVQYLTLDSMVEPLECFDTEIARLRSIADPLDRLNHYELEKLAKRWVLFQRLIRMETHKPETWVVNASLWD
ncbi:MAG: hypothetical protein BAA00_06215 [Parageobacillus thermoglucosidasius]|nr:MAG: hypothetical protein BAA00_06215 [Parageobacillus thermoglucosidasius]